MHLFLFSGRGWWQHKTAPARDLKQDQGRNSGTVRSRLMGRKCQMTQEQVYRHKNLLPTVLCPSFKSSSASSVLADIKHMIFTHQFSVLSLKFSCCRHWVVSPQVLLPLQHFWVSSEAHDFVFHMSTDRVTKGILKNCSLNMTRRVFLMMFFKKWCPSYFCT